jgi:antitoxin (DNA-binding transcriptional repressor) of toxin-antitoxin stability system
MSHTVTIEQAAQQLAQLVGSLAPGDEIVLTQNDRPIAKIVPERPRRRRHAGMCKGMLIIKSDDDEHLKDFADYMP